jgi:ABC-type transporter Mla MlaB component
VFEASEGEAHAITLDGAATFVSLPKLSETLERVPAGTNVRIDASRLDAVDHTTSEMLRDWLTRRRATGATVEVTGGRGRMATLAES